MPDITHARGPKPGPYKLKSVGFKLRVIDHEWLHEERDRTGESLSRIVGRGIERLRKEREEG